MDKLLLLSVFVIATCGLVYELIVSTIASYLLGDSVFQFSTVIGVYLFSMGIGSWLSKYLHKALIRVFVQVELLIALLGGFSGILLFVAFDYVSSFRLLLYSNIGLIGALVGLEIPILMRIMKERLEFKDMVSKVFTLDYIGALAASLLFPLILVPHLGLVRSALMFGLFNAGVALWMVLSYGHLIPRSHYLKGLSIATLLALGIAFAYGERILNLADSSHYTDPVVVAKASRHQKIVVTRAPGDVRLFLNSNLQFSTRDEYRYHEALVHMGLAGLKDPRTVLVLGGGDGMAVREVLKYPSVEQVTLVDLDPEMTRLFREQDDLSELNAHALRSPKVRIVNADAMEWVRKSAEKFDFIVLDFPDPSNFSLGKLFSLTFYQELSKHLNPEGMVVVQSTSPFVARKSFWCVNETLEAAGFQTLPYHVLVPSFGDWGFILVGREKPTVPKTLPQDLKFLTPEIAQEMTGFPKDVARVATGVNRLNNQLLVRYFEEEWSAYLR